MKTHTRSSYMQEINCRFLDYLLFVIAMEDLVRFLFK